MASLLHSVLVPAFMALCLVFSAACGGSDPAARADEAQAALSTGDYGEARSQAEAGLKAGASADKSLAWKLERIRVEAIAKLGDGPEVQATLTRLRASYPQQCDASFYAKIGNLLFGVGQSAAAVEVADAGMKQFPDRRTEFEQLMQQLVQAAEGGDSAAMEKLKGLGYVGG
jgi:hypothetical protein